MRIFDYSFLKNKIPNQILNLAAIIYDLRAKEEYRKKDNPLVLANLMNIAIIESIKGSNAIEGIVTTDKRIEDIAHGDITPLTHSEQEITGYRDVLNNIHNNHNELNIDIDLILYFHKSLFSYSINNNIGSFKKENNYIMEIDKDGRRKIRFTPTKASEVEDAMLQWIYAYYDAKQDYDINPLLLIPCVVLDFLCIHPFDDGNGRISRLLTILLLYKSGFDIGKYISIESKINEYKDAYYASLHNSSIGWEKKENDYIPFIINFIQILYQCYKELDSKFIFNTIPKTRNKSLMIEEIIFNSLTPISKSQIKELTPNISIQTIENTLHRLLKENKIKKIGTYKNAKYIKK